MTRVAWDSRRPVRDRPHLQGWRSVPAAAEVGLVLWGSAPLPHLIGVSPALSIPPRGTSTAGRSPERGSTTVASCREDIDGGGSRRASRRQNAALAAKKAGEVVHR